MKELLEATKRTVAANTYPGYPTKRLVIENIDEYTNLTLPDGEWSTGVFIYPTLEQQENLRSQGYELDDLGRPLHPWLREMLSEPNVGVVTGLGEYWHWGANCTADPIVINNDTEPKILLIQRKDIGTWALPGGFIDNGESAVQAGRRELFEETGLKVTSEPDEIYSGVVADARTTAHAWAETTALLWRVDGTPDITPDYAEVQDARWFPVNELPNFVHGSHAIIIDAAVKKLDEMDTEKHHQVKGGHMLYHRTLVTAEDGTKAFIKRHDQHAFTDPVREQHSRQYLHKEKKMYDHVREHGFRHIPRTVELQDGHTLVLEAFAEDDGWHWRAPSEHIDAYITDAFHAIDTLESIPLPDDFYDAEGSSHELFYKVSPDGDLAIQQRFKPWYPKFRDHFRETAERLAHDPEIHIPETPLDDVTVLAHHDLRQANIAWHPAHGAKFVDWSWAGAGLKNSDATMLLIDLHKSGHDVSKHIERFNPSHAKALINFWLRQCLLEPRTPDSQVRFQQGLSAVSAYDLLMKYR